MVVDHAPGVEDKLREIGSNELVVGGMHFGLPVDMGIAGDIFGLCVHYTQSGMMLALNAAENCANIEIESID